jgi:hypothetical protein
MHGIQGGGATLGREARLRDPAHRDQDGTVWRRGRFPERVRRQWNPVEVAGDPASEAGLDALARTIQARVGGDVEEIRARLDEFAALDDLASPPAIDPLVQPGAPA